VETDRGVAVEWIRRIVPQVEYPRIRGNDDAGGAILLINIAITVVVQTIFADLLTRISRSNTAYLRAPWISRIAFEQTDTLADAKADNAHRSDQGPALIYDTIAVVIETVTDFLTARVYVRVAVVTVTTIVNVSRRLRLGFDSIARVTVPITVSIATPGLAWTAGYGRRRSAEAAS
jgi:hypothetical protein